MDAQPGEGGGVRGPLALRREAQQGGSGVQSMAQPRWNSSFEARHTSSGTRERGQVPHASCDTWDMRQLCVGRDLGFVRGAAVEEPSRPNSRGGAEFRSPWPSLDGIRALRHGTRAPVRESAAKSHMPHATHGTCASCVWGVTWGLCEVQLSKSLRGRTAGGERSSGVHGPVSMEFEL